MKKGRGCVAVGGGDSFLKEMMSVWTASRSSAGLRVFNHGCRSWQVSVNLSTSESILGSSDGTLYRRSGTTSATSRGQEGVAKEHENVSVSATCPCGKIT